MFLFILGYDLKQCIFLMTVRKAADLTKPSIFFKMSGWSIMYSKCIFSLLCGFDSCLVKIRRL